MRRPKKPQDPVKAAAIESLVFRATPRIVAALVVLAMLLFGRHAEAPAPLLEAVVAEVTPAIPLQEWSSDAGRIDLSAVLLGKLPPMDPRQRKPPCRETIGEEAISGACWLRLDVRPPCPDGEAWEHKGKCYAFALRAERLPQSGEPRPVSIADP